MNIADLKLPEGVPAPTIHGTEVELPSRQFWAVERLIRELWEHQTHGNGSGRYEVKRFEIHFLGYRSLSVVLQTGMKNDTGTMASVLCRLTAHVFVGPKGGYKARARGRNITGRKVYYLASER